MAIPGYQDFMLPLLQIAGDGKEHSVQEAMAKLAQQMKISEEDQQVVLASGQTRFYNRVMWAETYLYQSGLIEKTGRARFRISQRGNEVLKSNPSRIDNKFLEQFPEYLAFKNQKRKSSPMQRIQLTPRTPPSHRTSSWMSPTGS